MCAGILQHNADADGTEDKKASAVRTGKALAERRMRAGDVSACKLTKVVLASTEPGRRVRCPGPIVGGVLGGSEGRRGDKDGDEQQGARKHGATGPPGD